MDTTSLNYFNAIIASLKVVLNNQHVLMRALAGPQGFQSVNATKEMIGSQVPFMRQLDVILADIAKRSVEVQKPAVYFDKGESKQ